MNRREDQNDYQDRNNRGGNRDMGQSKDSMYRGAYRFEDHRTARDQYGDRHDNHQDDRGQANQRITQGASNNYGNMGSYGGAQGYGSARGGYGHRHEDRSGFDGTSGHGRDTIRRPGHERQIYGAYWDKNSFSDNENSRFAQDHRENRPDPNRTYRNDRNRDDDSRYEIYDDAQSHYNRGEYGNVSQQNPSFDFNRNMDDQPNEQRHYGSNQRPKNRQGSGNDQDRNYSYGTDYNEGNMAGSLSYGYDGHRGYPDDDRDRRYDPQTGRIRNERDRPRGGYDYNSHDRDNDNNRY
ncbi:hypothetical protein [Adhaeribacter aquaticus]|uniref:hypothetical protein n=1 Tax=Adhaeribacter aquaticus TaxID=299567 RepID=UPI00041C1CC5|nr:hypothetical protein [Adhaeribacter aquaticus]